MTTHRRDLVRMLGQGALALPFLRAFPARAAGGTFPLRLVVLLTSNGTVRDEWLPERTATEHRFRRILAPLAPVRDRVTVLDGLDFKAFLTGPRAAHGGLMHLLVGKAPIDPTGEGNRTKYTVGGPSLDQVIGKHVRGEAPFLSLELGVRCRGATNYDTPSYKGPWAHNPVVDNPWDVHDRLFRGIATSPDDPRGTIRGSVVDFVQHEVGRLGARLGSLARRQLDADLASLREIEGGFRALKVAGEGCTAPEFGAPIDHQTAASVPAIGKLQMDLLIAALRCDLARVATLSFYDANGGSDVLGFLGMTQAHHDLAHTSDAPGTPAGEALITINRWYTERFLYFLQRLDAVPEGDGTLLDNTVVVFANSLGNGKLHRCENVPFVLAGGRRALRHGQFLSFPQRSHNDLLLTLAQAFGLDVATFGDPELCSGPISELRV